MIETLYNSEIRVSSAIFDNVTGTGCKFSIVVKCFCIAIISNFMFSSRSQNGGLPPVLLVTGNIASSPNTIYKVPILHLESNFM
ncbi:MAG: hypothetical protein FJX80_10950 [Bacteroidetes bacterium]|nr:hypothetical protein [Bacteroidota bacterium]